MICVVLLFAGVDDCNDTLFLHLMALVSTEREGERVGVWRSSGARAERAFRFCLRFARHVGSRASIAHFSVLLSVFFLYCNIQICQTRNVGR